MAIPKHFSLKAEHPDSYEIHDSRDGASFHVAKRGLNLGMHANLSKIQKFADGGEVRQDLNQLLTDAHAGEAPPVQDQAQAMMAGYQAANDRAAAAPQTVSPELSALQRQMSDKYSGYAGQVLPVAEPTPAPVAPAVQDSIRTPAASELRVQAQPAPAAPQSFDKTPLISGYEKSIEGALSTKLDIANKSQAAFQDYANAVASMPTAQEVVAKYNDKNDKLTQQIIDNKIDPNRYWHNMDTGSKIAAGLAMVFGGFSSSNATHPNYAMETINKAIDRDIESQKMANEKNMTLWKMNRERMGSDLEANLATRNQALAAVQAQVQAYAAKGLGADAQLQAAPIIMQLKQQQMMNNFMLGNMQGKPGDEASFVNGMRAMQQLKPEFYKDMQDKYIPGVGVASIPIAEKSRQALLKYDQLDNQLDHAINFVKTIGTTFPLSDNNARAETIANNLKLSMNDLTGLTRLNTHEFEGYSANVGNPGAFRSSAELARLNEIKTALQQKKKEEAAALGIKPFEGAQRSPMGGAPQVSPQQAQQYLQWAQQNPQDPRSAMIMQKLGAH